MCGPRMHPHPKYPARRDSVVGEIGSEAESMEQAIIASTERPRSDAAKLADRSDHVTDGCRVAPMHFSLGFSCAERDRVVKRAQGQPDERACSGRGESQHVAEMDGRMFIRVRSDAGTCISDRGGLDASFPVQAIFGD